MKPPDMPRNTADNIVPTDRDLKNLDLDDGKVQNLIARAEQSDSEDRKLTIRQALKQYKAATFWAMFLSTSLIMEGYDLVTVRRTSLIQPRSNTRRLTPSMGKNNSRIDLVSMSQEVLARKLFHPHGNQDCPILLSSVSLWVWLSIFTHKIDMVADQP